ncbi:MAG: hypothetical protein WC855_12970 [Thermodesulfovibrionales bacterium]
MKRKLQLFIISAFSLCLWTGCVSDQVRGRLIYNNIDIDRLTPVESTFWFRSEEKGTSVTPTIKYKNGSITINGLPPGPYGMSVNIDANPLNPRMFPGDYSTWKSFTIIAGHRSDLDIELQKIIHLTSPVDNATVMSYGGQECADKIGNNSPVVFSWETLEDDVYYDYSIAAMQCKPFKMLKAMTGATTKDTSISLHLPHNEPNEFYLLTLTAKKNGKLIGQLVTHGLNEYKWEGWDYRFRIN